MGWIGKIIGGTLGLLIGGPLGAIAGAAIGHGVDVGRDRGTGSIGGWNMAGGRQQAELTFFIGTFSMLAKVASADGKVDRKELEAVERFMQTDLRLDPESATVARNIFNTALSSADSFESFARQFYNQFANQPRILELTVDVLYRVAGADGVVSREEEALIRKGAEIFGMHPSTVESIKNRYRHTDESAYAVLGCEASDDIDEIKRAYKRLVFEYHPDRIAAQGLPEEFSLYAKKKFQEIQDAYEKIRRERDF